MESIKRKFVHPTKISQHLHCAFCYEVFNDPVRIKCLHTFCKKCITQWVENHKKGAPCPICRESVKKRHIEKDLLAFQIINDLEISCSNRGCTWQGPLCSLKGHLESTSGCKFGDKDKPQWYIDYLNAMEPDFEKKELEEEALDPDLQELLNKNMQPSLAMRLYKPGESNDGLRTVLGGGSTAKQTKKEDKTLKYTSNRSMIDEIQNYMNMDDDIEEEVSSINAQEIMGEKHKKKSKTKRKSKSLQRPKLQPQKLMKQETQTPDSDDDSDLKLAIQLSLQDLNNKPQQNEKYEQAKKMWNDAYEANKNVNKKRNLAKPAPIKNKRKK